MTQQQDSDIAVSPVSPGLIGWPIAAFTLSILMITFNNAPMVLAAGFFAKTFAVILGTVLGGAGALIGDAIRKFAMPDGVFTSGGMAQLIWIKIFWTIGPQTIGLIAGSAMGCGVVLNY
ncbi:TPA: hypothetical protein SL658_000899 [Pseudomonas aeruginosa]|uniref:hypothetical protein n=1 Tax=Pseudomonas aeruginosa TaxID=287 RepID=UPI001E4E2C4F|nr:hypothetical protein [Pseudomonas aeruginosa]HCF9849678.1 hypothetical protein [Pseudomonas aeruginosa]HEJ5133696.1 hypothetical protein [Pseudomonas aeruginosa]